MVGPTPKVSASKLPSLAPEPLSPEDVLPAGDELPPEESPADELPPPAPDPPPDEGELEPVLRLGLLIEPSGLRVDVPAPAAPLRWGELGDPGAWSPPVSPEVWTRCPRTRAMCARALRPAPSGTCTTTKPERADPWNQPAPPPGLACEVPKYRPRIDMYTCDGLA